MESPSKVLFSLEGLRSLYEYSLACALNAPLKYISPKGDGHPVIIIPGLGSTDASTMYLRNFLRDIGYRTYPWGLGRNYGPREGLDSLLNELAERVEKIHQANNYKKVSIIGWSLGGIYAREMAKQVPDMCKQVITLGTPFKGHAASTNATMLYEVLSHDDSHKNPDIVKKISLPPPVPFTSIYSKSDGVVHWKTSIECLGNNYENIEIPGSSHLGLGHNPVAMYVIADRLSQKSDSWMPYKGRLNPS